MALETTPGRGGTTAQVSARTHLRSPQSAFRKRTLTPYAFIVPFGVLFVLFFIVPIIYAIYQSLFRSERSGLGLGAATVSFNGLGNYVDVLHDPNFFSGVGRVLLYGIVQLPVMLILALVLALLLDSTVVRGKAFFRLAFFVPYAIPGIIAALLWGYLYDPSLSPFVRDHCRCPGLLHSAVGWLCRLAALLARRIGRRQCQRLISLTTDLVRGWRGRTTVRPFLCGKVL